MDFCWHRIDKTSKNTSRGLAEKTIGLEGVFRALNLNSQLICTEISLSRQIDGLSSSISEFLRKADFVNFMSLNISVHFMESSSLKTP